MSGHRCSGPNASELVLQAPGAELRLQVRPSLPPQGSRARPDAGEFKLLLVNAGSWEGAQAVIGTQLARNSRPDVFIAVETKLAPHADRHGHSE